MKNVFIIGLLLTGLLFSCNNIEGNKNDKQNANKRDRTEHIPCFTFIYPITYILPDASTITVNSKNDSINKTALRTWHTNNMGGEEKLTLLYPLDVKLKDGSISTLENDEEMALLKKDCE